MAHDRLCQFRLDQQQILKVTANSTLANVLLTHQKVFRGSLSTFTNFTATIHVDCGITFRFYKPRPVPMQQEKMLKSC